MTQTEFNKKVALVLQARKIIKELRDADVIKDSYQFTFNAGFNGIEKRLNKIKPEDK
jgi:hypothetical protein